MSTASPIIVTGGAGFIGSAFVRQWIDAEASPVVVLDKLTYAGNLQSLACVQDNSRLTFRQGDIGDDSLVAEMLNEFQPAAILNFAAESHVDRSIDAPGPFVETNVAGTWRLLERSLHYWRQLDAARRAAFRFLHISTDEVFGPITAPGMVNETAPYAPSSPYAASKAAADHFVRAYHRTYGFPTLIAYASNNYGPFQFPEKLVPVIVLNALEGKPLPIYGDGSQLRDWLHVDDHCRALRAILRHASAGEAFNIASGHERANVELVKDICTAVDDLCNNLPQKPSAQLIAFVKDRPGHDRRYSLDWSKLRNQCGWQPTVKLDDGLRDTIRWYAANLDWVREVSAEFDRQRRLGKRHD